MFPLVTINISEIRKAGRILTDDRKELDKILIAEQLIEEWRKSHYYPIMTIQGTLRNHVKRMSDEKAIVVQRLKKMQTIKNKLKRFPTMRLDKMQDIGGCRAIFSCCEYVYELCKRLMSSPMKHDIELKKDYIVSPKEDGYRGIHLTVTYKSKKNSSYNGFNVELQIRTHAQHLWSTAVETVGTFLNCPLKSDQGPNEWLNFFKLSSSLIALHENCNAVPGTPSSKNEIIDAIRSLDNSHSILKQLSTIDASCNYIQKKRINSRRIYVLVIKDQGKNVEVSDYKKLEDANKHYVEAEKDEKNNAVLVSAASLEALRKAYPNYFMNISGFLELTGKLMEGQSL
jgi:inorganic pyrophosphatase